MAADTADTDPVGTGKLAASAPGEKAGGGQPAPTSAATSAQASATAYPGAKTGNDYPGPGISADPTDKAAANQISDGGRAAEIEFNIAADIIYNRARASFLTLSHRAFLLGAIIAGSTAASDLASAKLCAFGAAACAALDLVFDPATGAAVYRELIRSIHDVLVDLKQRKFTGAAMDEAEVALLKISGTETAPFHARREMAFNQTRLSFGREDLPPIRVGLWRRALSQVWRFEG